jgi:hypothetical protein
MKAIYSIIFVIVLAVLAGGGARQLPLKKQESNPLVYIPKETHSKPMKTVKF